MVTKAQKRIEQAKKAHGLAESWTDRVLGKLIESRWTVLIAGVVVVLVAVGAWVLV